MATELGVVKNGDKQTEKEEELKKILLLGVVLTLVAVLAVPAVALAGSTGTTTVTGTQANIIEVTAPSAISFGTFIVGSNSKQSTTEGTVTCNGATWHVTAKDLVNGGVMKTSGEVALAGKLTISNNGSTYPTADSGITYTDTTTLPFYVKQNVLASDKAGAYTITITFTGVIDS
jgi:hypothetical protein